MMTMDTMVFPAPRRIAAKEWEDARRKKNGAAVLDFRIPNSTTSGVESKAAMSCGANMKTKTPMSSDRRTEARMPKYVPFFVRSYWRAPRF